MGYPRSYGVSAAPRLERHKKACILHGVSAIIGVHEGSWHSRGSRVDASDATQKERPWGIRGVHGVSAASMGYPRRPWDIRVIVVHGSSCHSWEFRTVALMRYPRLRYPMRWLVIAPRPVHGARASTPSVVRVCSPTEASTFRPPSPRLARRAQIDAACMF